MRQLTVGWLWFGIVWCSAIGLSLLWITLPVLLPWHLTPAALLLLAVVGWVEVSIGREVRELVAELRRRKQG